MNRISDKDYILTQLRRTDWDAPIYEHQNQPLFKLMYRYKDELEQDGYVVFDEIEELYQVFVHITSAGRVFIDNGGYTAKSRKERIDTYFSRSNVLIAGLGFILSAIVSYCSYRSNNTGKAYLLEQKQRIDSLVLRINRMSDSISIMKGHYLKKP